MAEFFKPEVFYYFFAFPELILSKSTLANYGAPTAVCFAVLLNRSRELFNFFLSFGKCFRDEDDFEPLAPVLFEFISVAATPVA